MTDARLPVIVGVGEVVGDRTRDTDAAREPLALIADAIRLAAADTGAPTPEGLLAAADAVMAVRTSSWATDEAAARIGRDIGADPHHHVDTDVGGHWPARLLDRAAARIAAGEDDVALLVGGEAQAAVTALARAGIDPVADCGWSSDPGGPAAFDAAQLGTPAMVASGVMLPTRVYPLFQNALHAALGMTPAEGAARSAALYARLSEVAATNPIAWQPVVRTAEEIAQVTPGNRMICEPYPLAVNAMPHVDQAVAVLVMAVEAARAHGIPPDRWVHVWGGAGASDSADVLRRPAFDRSDAVASAVDRSVDRAGLAPADLDLIDVYSCFPVVPELIARHLGWDLDGAVRGSLDGGGGGGYGRGGARLSATGGHAAFGGPLSSYSLHAVATLTRRLRDDLRIAAVHANGGYLTEQHVVVLGTAPSPEGYVGDPDPVVVDSGQAPRYRDAADLVAAGGGPIEVVVETCTVEHGRDGHPASAIVVARTPAGERTAASTAPGDGAAAAAFSLPSLPPGRITHIGRTAHLIPAGDGVAISLSDPSPSPHQEQP